MLDIGLKVYSKWIIEILTETFLRSHLGGLVGAVNLRPERVVRDGREETFIGASSMAGQRNGDAKENQDATPKEQGFMMIYGHFGCFWLRFHGGMEVNRASQDTFYTSVEDTVLYLAVVDGHGRKGGVLSRAARDAIAAAMPTPHGLHACAK